jgi:soluble lytic murein transglycosylase
MDVLQPDRRGDPRAVHQPDVPPLLRERLAVWLLAATLVGLLGAGPATAPEVVRPLSFLPDGSGIALGARSRAGAAALGAARQALEAGDWSRFDAGLERASSVELLSDQVALLRAEAALARGEPDAALATLTALESLDPHELRGPVPIVQAQIDRVRARALLAAGDDAGARAAWRRAFEAESEAERRMDVKLEMVMALQQAGRLPADAAPETLATGVLQAASRPDEKAPEDRSPSEAAEAGDMLLARGRSADAADAYAEALSGLVEETQRRLVQQRRGRALFNLRRYDEARRAFQAAGGDAEARFWTGRAAARQGDVPEAMRVFAQLGSAEDPAWASHALFLLGTLQAGRGEHDAARESFRRVVGYTAFPERVREALWRLGWADFEAGRFVSAREHFLAMVASASAEGLEPDESWQPRYWAARAAGEAGQPLQAQAELGELAAEAPLSYYGLRAQERLGRGRLVAAPDAPPIVDADDLDHVEYWRLQRAALLIEAGLEEQARLELRELLQQPLRLDDRMAIGRVMAAADDYNGAERIVVDAFLGPLAEGLRPGVERLWWLAWPRAWPELVGAAPAVGVEPELVWAIMREESSFRPRVHSSAGAIGLMQLMPDTASLVAGRADHDDPEPRDLERPDVNIALGSRYLGELRERMDGRTSAMIASYNAGPRAVARWLEEAPLGQPDDVFVEAIPYSQTRAYAKRVLRSYWLYQRLYD